ncbi:MAG: ubiquinone biosynthesis regulatory protein kinase UbiB [Pseudomonadales bacterium]|nr:ubiquinone biosynthesis regulatory protein kinase UbiB [Pseudomonadales bacterium]MBO6597748.1 ubiquinone biosynthesis regulatory protein kinase UbiB [Pseudomonadales bacterium]MBO6823986.1 ubiquinone biosynthesis regulatory protein kinase UbiB [Pseudomonadales bacterium]
MTFFRALSIFFTLVKFRLDRNLPDDARSWWLSALIFPLRLIRTDKNKAVAARKALEALGPIFIKFGQLLSTRKDLFSEEMSRELEKLQDQVPPFDSAEARRMIEQDIGTSVDELFDNFSHDPMASASVAQVHPATLKTDHGPREVVVKVIRPGIDKVIRRDIKLMYFGARLLQRFWPDAKRLHPIAIVRDYERTILGELDLSLEAANTKQLRENWYGSGKLYVPVVYEEFSSRRIMVMERIYGVTATNLEALKAEDTDLKKLAHLGVEIFFTQVFEDNFFHADMHPGNVFVDITDPANPTYIALDCAIIGSLTDNDKNYLARNLLAFFRRDYDEVAKLHVQSGWVPSSTDVDEFSRVIRQVVDPFFQKPIKDISFGNVLLELFDTARHFDMEVQPQLVLLQKTLINIEGMGRQIYPDLDLWETAAPFMERWMNERVGIAGLIRRISENAPRWIDQLPDIPDLAYNTMVEIRELTEQTRHQAQTLGEVRQALQAQNQKSRYQKLGGIALIGAILSLLLPATGYTAVIDPVLSGSVLGTLGIYWLYIHA